MTGGHSLIFADLVGVAVFAVRLTALYRRWPAPTAVP
jgi:hypothetical protein